MAKETFLENVQIRISGLNDEAIRFALEMIALMPKESDREQMLQVWFPLSHKVLKPDVDELTKIINREGEAYPQTPVKQRTSLDSNLAG